MSGAFVFPGGKIDPQDADPKLLDLCDGLDDDLSVYRVAALREAFEECGVLIARRAEQDSLVSGADLPRLVHWRDRIQQGESSLHDFLSAEGLRLACDLLVHFAHWITPAITARRYDTQFFLVPAPADQLLMHDGHESVDSLWIRPRDAVQAAENGTHNIIFPTLCNLHKLGLSETVAMAVDSARGSRVVEVLPKRVQLGDDFYLVLPEAAGYPMSQVKLPRQGPRK